MTTEVAVLNRFGVAIAADSAATVQHMHNNQAVRKVYNTANKLFTLSKFEPVGVVVYNAAALSGIPWETIIKSYRKFLGSSKFPHLADYAASFFDWLRANKRLFDPGIVEALVGEACAERLKTVISGSQSDEDLRKRLGKKLSTLRKAAFVEGFDQASVLEIVASYGNVFDGVRSSLLDDKFKDVDTDQVREYLALTLAKGSEFSGYSGIVICGFGEDDYVPQMLEYRTDIVVLNRPRMWLRKRYEISISDNSHIVPFADKAIIETLLNGINPKFAGEANRGALELILSMPAQILGPVKEISDEQRAAYVNSALASLPTFFGRFAAGMDKYRRENHSDPIEQVISSLPIAELAAVAETLLGAAQIHKKINPGLETVGGPVDVAVISKGDGFVWIKRKHYFDSAINPSFAAKYLQV
jgi:hypothetical protein